MDTPQEPLQETMDTPPEELQDGMIRSIDGGSSPVSNVTTSSKTTSVSMKTFIIIAVAAVILGVATGYITSNGSAGGGGGLTDEGAPGATKTAKSAGIKDDQRFPDSAEGKLVEGGIDGEGSFHLERPGGESQNVYLTSSIVDMSDYVGKKVKVWGETFEGQKAGWLMDVGYIEIK